MKLHVFVTKRKANTCHEHLLIRTRQVKRQEYEYWLAVPPANYIAQCYKPKTILQVPDQSVKF